VLQAATAPAPAPMTAAVLQAATAPAPAPMAVATGHGQTTVPARKVTTGPAPAPMTAAAHARATAAPRGLKTVGAARQPRPAARWQRLSAGPASSTSPVPPRPSPTRLSPAVATTAPDRAPAIGEHERSCGISAGFRRPIPRDNAGLRSPLITARCNPGRGTLAGDNSKMRQTANDRVDFGPVFDVKLDTLIHHPDNSKKRAGEPAHRGGSPLGLNKACGGYRGL
jgi:hypothetical protein